MTEEQAETWAAQINAQSGKTVETVLAIGRLFIGAKKVLTHGELGRLFTEQMVPYSWRSAQYLMRIAQHEVLANTKYIAHLPATWSVLNELVTVPAPLVIRGIEEGHITPALSLAEARVWRCSVKHTVVNEPAPVSSSQSKRLYNPEARQMRLNRMREMAAEGWLSDQIADAVGLGKEHCRVLMKEDGIECLADRALGRRRGIDPNRMVEQIVECLEDLEADQQLIDFSRLDQTRLVEWIRSLQMSHRILRGFIVRLQHQERVYGIKKADAANIQNSASSH